MKMTPVTSSQIKAVGHDPATNTMRVEFNSGGVYDYRDVPASTYANLLRAPSAGRFLHAHVKGKFTHQKIEK